MSRSEQAENTKPAAVNVLSRIRMSRRFTIEFMSEKNSLEEKPFSYRQYKNGNVSVFYEGKAVTILKGKNAQKFSSQVENTTEFEAQMLMAKITGNFKRGNEREGKLKGK